MIQCNLCVLPQTNKTINFYEEGVPGVGVAIFIAGVPIGVFPGVSKGVEEPIWLAGVSSQRDFLLLAPGVGVSPTDSSPLSVRGVSAQPLPWPGVSKRAERGQD